MTTINNYLKGNFPVMKDLVVTTIESSFEHLTFAKALMNISYVENLKGKDRIVLVLNFDIAKNKRFLYESHEDVKISNKEVFKAADLSYILEYNFTLDDIEELKKIPDNFEKQIQNIYSKVNEFYTKNVKGTKYPLVMYIHGLDVLGYYLKEEAITRLILKMSEELETLRLLYFFICSDTIGEKIDKAINAVTNCKLLMQDSIDTKELLEAVVTMLISKRGGYSSHEHYRAFIKRANYNAIEFKKYKTEEEKPKIMERTDLNKMFKTSFNIEISDSQKKLRDQTALPYMKAQDQNVVYKDLLKNIQAAKEQGLGANGDIEDDEEDFYDPEQDEDDDFDV